MPIYGYACSHCDHSFDALQKMSDPKLRDCPECGEATLKKQLSAPKFRLKGQGWYETDFKTGDKRNIAGESDTKVTSSPAKADGGDSPAKTTDTKKSESKPASKAESKATSA